MAGDAAVKTPREKADDVAEDRRDRAEDRRERLDDRRR
jgi:hypothetical protein